MRIVAGQYGGRRLHVPKGRDIRPTSDKVRGAIFNSMASYIDIDGARVLDCFCGTGALGLEALSRGAEACVFIDKSKVSLDLAKQNAEDLYARDNCLFKLSDASKVHLGSVDGFDLVFLDPPYGQGLCNGVLSNLKEQDSLRDGAICVLETEKAYAFEGLSNFELLKDKEYGDTLVTYLRYSKSVP